MSKRIAIKEAKKSNFTRAPMGAAVWKSGRVLGRGFNQIRGSRLKEKRWNCSLHAEQAAILDSLKSDIKGATLYVIRLNPKGLFRNACPCSICKRLIESVGIKEVIYTNENGDWVKWTIK